MIIIIIVVIIIIISIIITFIVINPKLYFLIAIIFTFSKGCTPAFSLDLGNCYREMLGHD
jgi:hypothetical protein